MSDTYGLQYSTPFAYYDRDIASLRTSQGTLALGLIESLPILPKSGSMRNGQLYERPMLGHPTDENDSSSLLMTPTAGDGTGGGRAEWQPRSEKGGSGGLREKVKMLVTPTANLAINGGSQHPDKRKQGGHGPTLADQVEHLLPTSMTSDSTRTSKTFMGGNPTLLGALLPTPRAARGSSATETLYELGAQRSDEMRPQGEVLLPTPRATDGPKGGPTQRGSKGNLMLPSSVTRLETTSQQSNDGNNSQGLPLQLWTSADD